MSKTRTLGLSWVGWCAVACAAHAQETPPTPTNPAPTTREAPRLRSNEDVRDDAFAPARTRARRQALVASLPEGAVVVLRAAERGDDRWTYRPDPDFLYLTGCRDAGLTLVLQGETELLFAPAADPSYALWNGTRLAPGTPEAEATGIAEVVDRDTFPRRLRALVGEDTQVFVLGMDETELDMEQAVRGTRVRQLIGGLRQVKDAGEVALLQRAVDVTVAALTETIRSIEPGQSEHEVQGVIEYMFLRNGAQRPGFASIVGSGPTTCVLHYQEGRRQFGEGELVLMDVGAEIYGYTADITRTVPASGRFTPRQRRIYELVLRAQKAGIEAVRPGATLRDVHRAARRVIDQAGYGEAFPHGTSHWLGLDVHDVGSYGRPLEPGMVLTVEPGIYLPDENLGIRIEDDVLVTEGDPIVLSAGVPREVEELEALMLEEGVGNAAVAPTRRGPTTRH